MLGIQPLLDELLKTQERHSVDDACRLGRLLDDRQRKIYELLDRPAQDSVKFSKMHMTMRWKRLPTSVCKREQAAVKCRTRKQIYGP